jgi:hypothetical protein
MINETKLFRMEASDLMEIGHVTFDHALKSKMTKPRAKFTTGPFFQLVAYQFGSYKMLVRFEVDCADYAAVGKANRYRGNCDTKNDPVENISCT